MATLDNKGPVRAVFVDFRKAFDLVNHNILFRKFQNFNIPNCWAEMARILLVTTLSTCQSRQFCILLEGHSRWHASGL